MISRQQQHHQQQFVAYTPPVAPLTSAQRAQIAAALCERAKKRQAANAASNDAARVRWSMEMTAIKQRQAQHPVSLSRPLPVTLSMPHQNASSAPVFTPPEQVVHEEQEDVGAPAAAVTKPKYLVVNDKEEFEVGVEVNTKVETPVPVQTSVEQKKAQSSASVAVHTEKKEAEPVSDVTSHLPGAASGVIRPSLVDAIRSSLDQLQSKGKDEENGEQDMVVEEEEPKQVQEQANFEMTSVSISAHSKSMPGAESGVVRLNVFDAIGDAVSKFEDRQNDRKRKLSDTEEAELVSQAVAIPGAESGVIRPSLVDAVGSFLSKLQLVKQIRRRITADSKKLKEVATVATATGALTALFSLKK